MRKDIVAAMTKIEGMTDVPSGDVLCELLLDSAISKPGNMLEMGAYRGRSAFVLASCAAPGEKVFVLDPDYELDWAAIGEVGKRITFIKGESESLKKLLPDFSGLTKTFRFIHDDATHRFENVRNNANQANELLAPDGVYAVDDYENMNFPQLQPGLYAAIFADRCDFRPFMVVSNKAYFCRAARHRAMLKLTLERFGPLMWEEHRYVLARTDEHEFAPYYIRPSNKGETDRYYGAPEWVNGVLWEKDDAAPSKSSSWWSRLRGA